MALASCPPALWADYRGPGSGLDIGLVPQLVWLSSHSGSHTASAHHHMQHLLLARAVNCSLRAEVSTWAHTQENVRLRRKCFFVRREPNSQRAKHERDERFNNSRYYILMWVTQASQNWGFFLQFATLSAVVSDGVGLFGAAESIAFG